MYISSIAEYLKEFAMLSQGYDSDNQLLVNVVPEEDESGMYFICKFYFMFTINKCIISICI